MRRTSLLAGLAVLASVAPAQTIPHEKYKLANGMTVILAPDHNLPMVTINTWFRVGSKDEPERRSGFAHLFEHLMFMGTERVPNGQFDKMMEALGGQNNASTSTDRTNYYSSGPSHILKTLLWLDADRLQDLGRMTDKKKLDLQREVVRNERRQNTEQTPYGKAYNMLSELLYPVGHPYHNSVIGSHEDLEAASVGDVQSFFATYYVASNASLVIAGDFDPAEIKPYVAEVFGSLPRGNDAPRKDVPPLTLKGVKRATLTDKVKFPKVVVAWHSPAAYQPGDAAASAAAAILARGASSRLYGALVTKKGVASEVSAYQDSELLGSSFTIDATAAPGVSVETLTAEVHAVIREFVTTGPTESELRKVVAETQKGVVQRLQDVGRKADLLNEFEFYTGNPDHVAAHMAELRALTPESVKATMATVLGPDRLELVVVPEIEKPSADPRDTRPSPTTPKDFAPPAPVELTVDGVKVSYWHRPDVPLTDVRWVFGAGTALDPVGKLGRASLAAEMLGRGGDGLTGSEFETNMSLLGATLDVSAGRQATVAHLSSLTENFSPALKLAVSALKLPSLLPAEFESAKKERVAAILASWDDPARLASLVLAREYYGADHPDGMPPNGTEATVGSLTLDDLRASLQALSPANLTVFAAGSLTPAEFQQHLSAAMAGWKRGPGSPADSVATPAAESTGFRFLLVDRPGAPQTVIRMLQPGVPVHDSDRLGLASLGRVMGGSFTSRLNQNLREDKGYTYGAGAGFTFDKSFGVFSVRTSVRTDVTGASLTEILKELRGAADGNLTEEEAAKAAMIGRSDQIDALGTIEGLVSQSVSQFLLGRSLRELGADMAGAAKLKAPDLNRLAVRLGKLEKGVLLLVGDREKIMPQLKGLGLPDPTVIKP